MKKTLKIEKRPRKSSRSKDEDSQVKSRKGQEEAAASGDEQGEASGEEGSEEESEGGSSEKEETEEFKTEEFLPDIDDDTSHVDLSEAGAGCGSITNKSRATPKDNNNSFG
jgi:hypothetical protein